MKLRIYGRPWVVVFLLGLAAVLLWWTTLAVGGWPGWIALPPALFYSLLLAVAAWAAGRRHRLERSAPWNAPQRLLILAPHEDDCVIAAGGIGARNFRLGGATRILYLAPDEAPGMAATRAAEARAAWRHAGLDRSDLRHLALLPPLGRRDPEGLRAAAATLRAMVDEFRPTTVIVPMFEGGHIHHDMTAALMASIVTDADSFELYEAPEYGPYVSLNNTPHRILALAARWLFGLVAYYGPPDGIDGRTVHVFRLDHDDIDCKRRMLAAFASQNAPSLVATRSYPDRLVRRARGAQRRHPFDYRYSYLRLARWARRALPGALASPLLPVQEGPVGRDGGLTDWQEEWAPGAASGSGPR